MKGPHPKSAHLKLVDGNRSKRPINKAEPKPEAGISDPPDVLNAEAKEEWRRVTPLLLKAGVLTTIDRSALAAYCASFARWQAAERQLASSDLVIRTARGGHVANPLLRIAAKAQSGTVKFATEFGMSPASRTRVRVNNDKKASPEDSFFPDAS